MEKDLRDSKEVPDKPFKNIEVVDNETSQTCKVACMSCIRGHRTTSCGIKSCRHKVFWTVKKPGRPSNTCTCAYRQAGGCKCNLARSQCPHKPKKGEKRSAECRCDENGRYCCLLPPEAWPKLQAGGRPVVQFYKNRDELEMEQVALRLREPSIPSTPTASEMAPGAHNGFSTPPSRMASVQGFFPFTPQRQQSETSVLAPRFGLMGIGAPLGSESHVGENVFDWGDISTPAPMAPRERQSQMPPQPQQSQPHPHQPQLLPRQSCCGSQQDTPFQSLSPADHKPSISAQPQQQLPSQSCCGSKQTPSVEWENPFNARPSVDSQVSLPGYGDHVFNDFVLNYNNYMMPSAMCQQCGRVGCHCSACPPLMQMSNSHWGTGCARTHERMTTMSTGQQAVLPTQDHQQPISQPAPLEAQHLPPQLFSAPFQEHVPAMDNSTAFQQQMVPPQQIQSHMQDAAPVSMPMLAPLQTQMRSDLVHLTRDPMMPQMSGPESPTTFHHPMQGSFELSPHSQDPFDEYIANG